MGTIKGITNCRLYKRSAPDINAERLGVWKKGETVAILHRTKGSSFEGSDEWYELEEGVFSWAGGINVGSEEVGLTVKVNESIETNRFRSLSNEEQRKVIHNLIQEKASGLKNEFPEIQGFSARKKLIRDVTQSYYALHIDVIEKKQEKSNTDIIPTQIRFIAKDNHVYAIPTDITGVGENRIAHFIGDNEMPKKLGLSCSRKGDFSCGTIGLKVYKNGIPHLLSCYHVLCEPEMNNEITTFSSGSSVTNTITVVSPGTREDGANCKEIAEITEGVLNNSLDVALARLKDNNDLVNEYFNHNGTPNGRVELTTEDTSGKITVKLFGRTSEKRRGKLTDHYQDIVYFNNYPSGTISELHGLIVTEKISEPGDSGATVVNNQNEIIGLLVGSNSKKSYLIPINRIFRKLKLDKNLN